MATMTIRDYAKERGISYESARKSVRRFEGDLKGHTRMDGRTMLLDEEAVALLDEKRRGNPIVVVNEEKREEVERLRAENTALLHKIAELQDALLAEKDKVSGLLEEKMALLEERKQDSEDGHQDPEEVEVEEDRRRWWQFWKKK